MALVTWVGGNARFTTPNVWSLSRPVTGDTAQVYAGHVISINDTVSDFDINLVGQTSPAAFDGVRTTINGQITSAYTGLDDNQDLTGHGAVYLLGRTVLNGYIYVDNTYINGSSHTLNVTFADVLAPSGVVIEQASLINNGYLDVSSVSGSPDLVIYNNGTFDGGSSHPILGKGTLGPDATASLARSPNFSLGAVGSGQTLYVDSAVVTLLDPINFRGTIADFKTDAFGYGALSIASAVTSALYVHNTLTLMKGTTIVAELKFSGDVSAKDIGVSTSSAGTFIYKAAADIGGNPVYTSNLAIGTSGSTPILPPMQSPALLQNLQTSGPDLTLSTGATVGSVETLGGYTIHLAGLSDATAPALDISSVTFGANFALRDDGSATSASFGSLVAVGTNENDGTIATSTSSNGNGGALLINLADLTSPDGVTILAGSYTNTGTITAGAGSSVAITGSVLSRLINTGTLTTNGMMFLGTTVTGTGAMTIGNHSGEAGTLEIGGTVAASQSINLEAGQLVLDHIAGFYATISDFDARDAIVLKGVDVSTVTYNNGTLLLDGGAEGKLHLQRPTGVIYDSGSFQLIHNGADTIITTPVLT